MNSNIGIRLKFPVVRKGCVALHYSVHFFFFFDLSLSRNDRYLGGGYRRKICTVPTPFVVTARPARGNYGFELRAMCMIVCTRIPLALPLYPAVSVYTFRYTWPLVQTHHFLERVGQTNKRCGNRTDLAPIPSPSITIVA